MVRLLEEQAKSGVEIRIIGRINANNPEIAVRRPHIRLHARTIIRDGTHAFIGSQSLRKVELDDRREVGIVIRDRKAVAQLVKIFDEDWAAAAHSPKRPQRSELTKAAKRVARAVTKDMPPIFEVVEEAVKTVVGNKTDVELDSKEIEETVKDAVTEAVKEAVRDVVEGAVSLADHDAT
jgi:histone H3/H4